MILVLLMVLPLVAAMMVIFARPEKARLIALIGTVLPLLWYCVVAMPLGVAQRGAMAGSSSAGGLVGAFDWNSGEFLQLHQSFEWVPALGLKFEVGVDAVAMLLIGLTVLLGPICVIASFTAVKERVKTYYAWILVLQAAMTGVFCARDVILFYTFFEFTLVPMYVLISLYGSTNRKAAATKFFLYTFTGSILTLAGVLYVAYFNATQLVSTSIMPMHGSWSLNFDVLQEAARQMSLGEQSWVLAALLAGFAVKVPLFPVHTWLPLAHTEAPTAGSVILAGVLLKLGTFGIYRFALGWVPDAVVDAAPLIAVLSIIGILYAGLVCWVQTDVKKLVAYSSVSHLGFCVLGMVAFNTIGLSGSVLYMINHGLSTGALFLLIGMMYERYHTRSMREVGGLAKKMPIWATFMVFFTMASVGLPGLNGFISEFMCLLGTFQGSNQWAADGAEFGTRGVLGPWFAFFAGIGMIIAAMYLLTMLAKVVWGPLREPGGHGHSHGSGHGHASDSAHAHGELPPDLTAREIGVLAPLAILCIVLGIFPTPVLRALEDPTREALAGVTEVLKRNATESASAGGDR